MGGSTSFPEEGRGGLRPVARERRVPPVPIPAVRGVSKHVGRELMAPSPDVSSLASTPHSHSPVAVTGVSSGSGQSMVPSPAAECRNSLSSP